MKCTLSILLSILLLACSSKEEKVIDIHDVLPGSKNEDINSTTIVEADPYEQVKIDFSGVIVDLKEVGAGAKKHFIDRFEADTSFNYVLFTQIDSLNYREWRFKDSVKTRSAFFNWIDHAAKGETVVVGTPFILNDQSFQLLLNDTMIVFIEAARLEQKKWTNYFKESGIEDWDYILQQNGRAKARWFSMKEGKLVPLKP